MKLTRAQREEVAAKRLIVNLRAHGIANARTLEQKISDAGPYGQRIDPHVLTSVRQQLVADGKIEVVTFDNVPWYYLPDTAAEIRIARLAAQQTVYRALSSGSLPKRIGQCLEIATYRALLTGPLDEFHGRYRDLNDHDDSTLYSKEEPPQHVGAREIPGKQNLDFLVRHPEAGYLGLECKNTRPWLYPDDEDISETLAKCIAIDAIPVLIARRIPFVTFRLFSSCGVIMHQTYNQLLPAADAELAGQAKDKTLLGYHDIRLGNEADGRLLKFIHENLDTVAAEAREKYQNYLDLLDAFASGSMRYAEFAARVRRRTNGEAEDFDEDVHPPFPNTSD
jgi:hypothetical protein